jgi:hypothetical protein
MALALKSLLKVKGLRKPSGAVFNNAEQRIKKSARRRFIHQ